MIERVVVPVGFTKRTDRTVAVAAALAARLGSGLHLLRVARPGEAAKNEAPLAELAARAGGEATWRVVESSAGVTEALVAELQAGHDELWCLGSRAKGPVGEILTGSVSEDLVRVAHAPIVLVGPHVEGVRPLVVMAAAIDGSEPSEAILPVAAELAGDLKMSLQLLQVGDPTPEGEPGDDFVETAYLINATERVPVLPSAAVEFDFIHGSDAAASVAGYVAAYQDVALVAMTTRGLSGPARLVNPSTAFDLARESVVPVVILRPA